MCIVLWSTSQTSKYKLIIASNMDEYLDRPSLRSDWHRFDTKTDDDNEEKKRDLRTEGEDDHEKGDVISGLDKIGGGTWLAIQRWSGRFGFLTNVLRPDGKDYEEEPGDDDDDDDEAEKERDGEERLIIRTSRGSLIRDYLIDNVKDDPESYINDLNDSSELLRMNGFNLVLGRIDRDPKAPVKLSFYSNRSSNKNPEKDQEGQTFKAFDDDEGSGGDDQAPGDKRKFYGLSNAAGFRTPKSSTCPLKVSRGVRLMKSCIKSFEIQGDQDEEALVTQLFGVLSQTNDSSSELLDNVFVKPFTRPRTNHLINLYKSPVDTESCEDRSSSYPKSWYGTKTQTLILVSDDGKVTFIERGFDHSSLGTDEDFKLDEYLKRFSLRKFKFNLF